MIPKNYQPQQPFATGDITPRDYQWYAYDKCAEFIRACVSGKHEGPRHAYAVAATGAGKSLMIAMVAARCQAANINAMMLTRQGELVEQNHAEAWNIGVKNSVYCASLQRKSTAFPIVYGSEGTVCRSLHEGLESLKPKILLIDEGHMVDWQDCMKEEPEGQYGKIIAELKRRYPGLIIIMFTGSPFRGTESVKGPFWTEKLCDISDQYLTDRGYLTPTVFGFGHDEVKYDLHEWSSDGADGASDFTRSEREAMQRKILKDGTTTQKIMLEVQELAKDRNGVLITCSGKRHCEEAAQYLPEGSYGIVTDSISTKERRNILKRAKSGDLKYVFQVGCLTTGVNVPCWDTVVILRRIGSLTLLVQLIGRGLRPFLNDPEQAKSFFISPAEADDQRKAMIAASDKPDCLVLDYTETMDNLGELYLHPILEDAQLQKAKQDDDYKTCPTCQTKNNKMARRCIGRDASNNRCEHFWSSRICGEPRLPGQPAGCGTVNDTAARECRSCGMQLIDPNAKLNGKHYTDADLIPVIKMTATPTKNKKGLVVYYQLDDQAAPKATEIFQPGGEQWQVGQWYQQFVKKHIRCPIWQKKAMGWRSPEIILKNWAVFDVPTHITHRLNDKGKSVINRKRFRSGREEIDQSSTDGTIGAA